MSDQALEALRRLGIAPVASHPQAPPPTPRIYGAAAGAQTIGRPMIANVPPPNPDDEFLARNRSIAGLLTSILGDPFQNADVTSAIGPIIKLAPEVLEGIAKKADYAQAMGESIWNPWIFPKGEIENAFGNQMRLAEEIKQGEQALPKDSGHLKGSFDKDLFSVKPGYLPNEGRPHLYASQGIPEWRATEHAQAALEELKRLQGIWGDSAPALPETITMIPKGGLWKDSTRDMEIGMKNTVPIAAHEFRHAWQKDNTPEMAKDYPWFPTFQYAKYRSHPREVDAYGIQQAENFIGRSERVGQPTFDRDIIYELSKLRQTNLGDALTQRNEIPMRTQLKRVEMPSPEAARMKYAHQGRFPF